MENVLFGFELQSPGLTACKEERYGDFQFG